jgi:rhodanese-related sulfurtransferase
MQDLTIFISQHPGLFSAAAIIFVLAMIVELLRAKRGNSRIDIPKAIQFINHDNAVVIDIRANDLYRKGHIIDAHSIAAKDLTSNTKKIEKFKTRPIIITCNAGLESQKVAALLLKQGYNAYSLSGGTRAWTDAGMPLIKE